MRKYGRKKKEPNDLFKDENSDSEEQKRKNKREKISINFFIYSKVPFRNSSREKNIKQKKLHFCDPHTQQHIHEYRTDGLTINSEFEWMGKIFL